MPRKSPVFLVAEEIYDYEQNNESHNDVSHDFDDEPRDIKSREGR